MKSERRHELGHNQLADWLGQQYTLIKPYANQILIGLLVILLVVALVVWLTNRSAAATATTWEKFYAALDDDTKLADFADANTTNEAGQLAAVLLGDRYLYASSREIFKNKIQAMNNNGKAVSSYKSCLSRATKPTLRQRATFGLARAEEVSGEIKQAVAHYEEIEQRWPDSLYATYAAQRLRDLKNSSTKEMYDWLAQYDPKPFSPTDRPAFDPSVPDEPAPTAPRTTPATTYDLKLDGPNVKPLEERMKEPEKALDAPRPDEGAKDPAAPKPEMDEPATEVEKPASGEMGDKPADAPKPDESPKSPAGDKPE